MTKQRFARGKQLPAKKSSSKTFKYQWLSPSGELLHYVEIPKDFVLPDKDGNMVWNDASQAIYRNGARIVREIKIQAESYNPYSVNWSTSYFQTQKQLGNKYLNKRGGKK